MTNQPQSVPGKGASASREVEGFEGKLSVLLVGLGNVGMGYDLETDMRTIKSHASAFLHHPHFKLLAGVDPDPKVRIVFDRRFQGSSYSNVTDALESEIFDVVVVASPTKLHKEQILEILHHCAPKVILCEKPLSYDLTSAREIVQACRERRVKLLVNYHRRADPAVLRVRRMIESGEIIKPFRGTIQSRKGLIHNGTHFLDLMTFWFGKITKVEILGNIAPVGDLDGNRDLRLIFDGGRVDFLSTGAGEEVADISLEFANGSLDYLGGGRTAKWAPSSGHGVSTQANSEINLSPGFSTSQFFVAQEIWNEIHGTRTSLCSGEQAVEILELATRLLRQE